MRMRGNTILITGGGSGIGRELARAFHAEGNEVVVAGRGIEALNETVGGRARMHAAVLDVDDPADIEAFATRLAAEHPGVNVLINNAGIMRQEDLASGGSLADAEAMITTNLLGPIRLLHALLPRLMGSPGATVINVSSGLAFVPLIRTPTYNATKAAIHSYTLSLREQMREAGVEVLEVIPPAVQTELTPGQSENPGYMPLEDFIEETMEVFRSQPTPSEIAVARLAFLRRAEAEGRFDQTFAMLNQAR